MSCSISGESDILELEPYAGPTVPLTLQSIQQNRRNLPTRETLSEAVKYEKAHHITDGIAAVCAQSDLTVFLSRLKQLKLLYYCWASGSEVSIRSISSEVLLRNDNCVAATYRNETESHQGVDKLVTADENSHSISDREDREPQPDNEGRNSEVLSEQSTLVLEDMVTLMHERTEINSRQFSIKVEPGQTQDSESPSKRLKPSPSNDEWNGQSSVPDKEHQPYIDLQNLSIGSSDKPYHCHHCNKDFTQLSRLQAHLRYHTGEKPFACPHCDGAFVSSRRLLKHLNVHGREKDKKPFKCQQCQESLPTLNDLKRHIRNHMEEGNEQFGCQQCGKMFRLMSDLNRHQQIHSTNKPHSCAQCGRGFLDLRSYEQHVRIHTGEKPHQCPICDRSFTQLSTLQQHKRRHSGERPYLCHICHHTCAQAGSLTRHLLTHTNEKPFKCPQCDQSFRFLFAMRKHQRTHSSEKPFMCQDCGKAFSDRASFKCHMHVHMTGVKPFTCMVCNEGLSTRNGLRRHMILHTGTKPFRCQYCGAAFARVDNLRTHMKIHRPPEMNTHGKFISQSVAAE